MYKEAVVAYLKSLTEKSSERLMKKERKFSITLVGVLVEVRTRDLPNTSQEHDRLGRLAPFTCFERCPQ
jgi:hypothetical protein